MADVTAERAVATSGAADVAAERASALFGNAVVTTTRSVAVWGESLPPFEGPGSDGEVVLTATYPFWAWRRTRPAGYDTNENRLRGGTLPVE